MGSEDRVIRLIIAVIIAFLYFGNIITGTLALVLIISAGVFLITSSVGFCPIYAPFKLSTRKS